MTEVDPGAEAQQARVIDFDVSVLLVTYNHARFVGRALDSVLMQRGVRFEIIVSEDCSSDGTLEIVRSKLAGHPHSRIIASDRNLASNEPILRAIRAARGRYVSIIDGDDFWTVDDKLMRQVQVLDGDPSLSACFHNALILHGDEDKFQDGRYTPPRQPARIGASELWQGNPFAIFTGMMRRDAVKAVGRWYVDSRPKLFTDWPLYLTCAERGDLLFIDEPVGAYRIHPGGEFSGLREKEKLLRIASFYRQMEQVEEGRWAHSARAGASHYFAAQADRYVRKGDKAFGRLCARLALRAGGVGRSVPWRAWAGLVRRSLA
jgi:glycosyltransferase involved in cell wall biosynthesis